MSSNNWDICYSKRIDFTHINPDLMQKAAKPTSKGMKALDFGCGTGKNSVTLEKLGYVVDGIDRSSEAISLAKQKSESISFVVGSEKDIPLKKYNLILVSLVYKFIDNKEEFLKRLFDALAINGKLIMYNPTKSIKDIAVDDKKLIFALKSIGFKNVHNINTSYCGNDVLVMTCATRKDL